MNYFFYVYVNVFFFVNTYHMNVVLFAYTSGKVKFVVRNINQRGQVAMVSTKKIPYWQLPFNPNPTPSPKNNTKSTLYFPSLNINQTKLKLDSIGNFSQTRKKLTSSLEITYTSTWKKLMDYQRQLSTSQVCPDIENCLPLVHVIKLMIVASSAVMCYVAVIEK